MKVELEKRKNGGWKEVKGGRREVRKVKQTTPERLKKENKTQ